MNQLTVSLIVVIGILGGFYFGAKYGQGHPTPSASPAAATTTGGGGAAGTGGFGGGGGGFGGGADGGAGGFAPAASGAITAVSGNTITVHDRSTGKDVKVDVSAARISRTTQGTASDLTQNETVTVIGQAGPDGTVSAQTIAIGGAGVGRQGRSASPAPAG